MPTLAFGPKARILVTGGTDGRTRIWKVDGLEPVHSRKGHAKTLYASAFHPRGRLAATASSGGRICVWDVATGRHLGKIETGGRVNGLAFGGDGELLYVGGHGGVAVYELIGRRRRADLPGQAHPTWGLAVHPDGHTLASSSKDGVRVWDLRKRKLVCRLGDAKTSPLSLSLHPTLPLVAVGTRHGTVVVWNHATGRRLQVAKAHEGTVFGVAFNPTGDVLATGGRDKLIRLFRVRTPL